MDTPILAARLRDCAAAIRRVATRSGFAMRRAVSCEDWAAVRALRFAALASHGDVARSDGPVHGDRHDAEAATSTFLLTRNGRPVGSTRTTISRACRPARLPAMDAFERDLGFARGATNVVEASLTVVDPAAPDPASAVFHMFKAHVLACAACDADWLVAAVRETQMGFYRRAFGMEILGGAESVPGLAVRRVLMGLRYREQAALLFRRIPLLALTAADERRFAARGHVVFSEGRAATPAAAPCD
jgi:hypothetical protein